MSKKYRLLSQESVVSVNSVDKLYKAFLPHSTFTVEEAITSIMIRLFSAGEIQEQWTESGVACSVLTPHLGWQQGKVRLCFEFCPDEPESVIASEPEQLCNGQNLDELDELRLSIAEGSSNG